MPEFDLTAFSDALAGLASAAAPALVAVEAGGRHGSSAFHWRDGLYVGASEAIETDDAVTVTVRPARPGRHPYRPRPDHRDCAAQDGRDRRRPAASGRAGRGRSASAFGRPRRGRRDRRSRRRRRGRAGLAQHARRADRPPHPAAGQPRPPAGRRCCARCRRRPDRARAVRPAPPAAGDPGRDGRARRHRAGFPWPCAARLSRRSLASDPSSRDPRRHGDEPGCRRSGRDRRAGAGRRDYRLGWRAGRGRARADPPARTRQRRQHRRARGAARRQGRGGIAHRRRAARARSRAWSR